MGPPGPRTRALEPPTLPSCDVPQSCPPRHVRICPIRPHYTGPPQDMFKFVRMISPYRYPLLCTLWKVVGWHLIETLSCYSCFPASAGYHTVKVTNSVLYNQMIKMKHAVCSCENQTPNTTRKIDLKIFQ